MTAAPSIRPLTIDDAPALVALNDAAHPAVPITSAETIVGLLELATLARGIERDDALVGFVIAMAAGAAYDSENFQWFERRGTGHVYVDRIVVAESERGRGLGPVLYEAVFAEARRLGHPEVTCEVNLDPPNPGSMAFHARLGFAQVGTQPTKGGSVTVALLAAPVA